MQRVLAMTLFTPGVGAYLTCSGALPGCLGKEVIHVSLSLCRGIVAGLDHLERKLDWGTRLILAPL
jgi:hypothetical protein